MHGPAAHVHTMNWACMRAITGMGGGRGAGAGGPGRAGRGRR